MAEGLLDRLGWSDKEAKKLAIGDVDVLEIQFHQWVWNWISNKKLKNSRTQGIKTGAGNFKLGVGAGEAAVRSHFGVVA